jgi:hypothetical protein
MNEYKKKQSSIARDIYPKNIVDKIEASREHGGEVCVYACVQERENHGYG